MKFINGNERVTISKAKWCHN